MLTNAKIPEHFCMELQGESEATGHPMSHKSQDTKQKGTREI